MKKLVVVIGVLILVLAVVAVGLGGAVYVQAQENAPMYALQNNTTKDGYAGVENLNSVKMKSEVSMNMEMKSEVLSVLGESDTLSLPVDVATEITLNYESDEATLVITDPEGEIVTQTMSLDEYKDTLTIDEETLSSQFAGTPYTVTEVTEGDETSWVYTLTIDASHTEVVDNLKSIITSSFIDGVESDESGVTLGETDVQISDDFEYVIEVVISQETYLVTRQTETMKGQVTMTTEYTGELGETLQQNGFDTQIMVTVSDIKSQSTFIDIQLKNQQPTDVLQLWIYENL